MKKVFWAALCCESWCTVRTVQCRFLTFYKSVLIYCEVKNWLNSDRCENDKLLRNLFLTKNEIIFILSEGKRHDSGMLADSGSLRDLEQHAFSTLHEPMCMYGDPAYPHRVHLQSPFREAVLADDMKLCNASMSACLILVEWLFGDVMNYFKFLDYKKNLKTGMSSVGKMWFVQF